jgi:hypothetical protein
MPWLPRTLVVATALVGAVPVLLLAVATAWLLSNGSDIAPRPRPAVLQLPAPALPDERNAFFALVGLTAEAGRDPATVGRALWQLNLARAAMPQKDRFTTSGLADINQQYQAIAGQRLPLPNGAPLYCKDGAGGCVADWLAEPVALAAQRQEMALLGARCDALLAPGTGFEERLPSPAHYVADIAPHMSGARQCSNWWRSGAVLAGLQGQPQQTLALLQRAAQLDAVLLAGSHSLVANLVASGMARDTQATVVMLTMRDPSLAPQLTPLLLTASKAGQVAAARRWIASESAFQQVAMSELAECMDPDLVPRQPPAGWAERQRQKLEGWQCRNRVGLMPERNKALMDDYWVGASTALDGGLQAAIRHVDEQTALATQRGWQWQNTLGHILLDLSAPSYGRYLRQAADLPLHTEAAALALAVAAERVPAAERAAWAQGQPLSATLRERLQWDASGQGFTVRTFAEEGQTTPLEPRRAIRFAWPASPQG